MSLYHYVTLVIFMSFLVAVTPGSDLFHLVIAQEGDKDAEEEEADNDDNEDFEEENSIQICCSWGSAVSDGILSYHIDDEDDDSSENQQQAVRNAVEEWDTKIEPLELEELSSNEKSDIKIEFQEGRGEGEGEGGGEGTIAGQSLNVFDASGFIDNVQIIIYKQVSDYEFNPAQIEQITKHEMGHALGLGHANFEGNLMAERITAGTETISECEVKAVYVANNWKITEEQDDDDDANNSTPDNPPNDNIICV
jgi:Matrixin